MNNSNQLIEKIINEIIYPSLRRAGIDFKSECSEQFNLIRVDDMKPVRQTKSNFYINFDIRKNGVKYKYTMEVRLEDGFVVNVIDLTKGPIKSHLDGVSKLVDYVNEFTALTESLGFFKSQELRTAILNIAC